MEIAKRKNISLQLNIAPLIDIVFLLLIFFMLTSTFMKEEAIELALPHSDTAQLVENEALRISVSALGEFILNGKSIRQELLLSALQELRKNSAEATPALLQVSKEADVQLLVTAMDILKEAGFTDISLATE